MNGREKAVCVRNMTPHEILSKAELLRTASGEKLRKQHRAGRRVVTSDRESIRGVWSGLHTAEKFKL